MIESIYRRRRARLRPAPWSILIVPTTLVVAILLAALAAAPAAADRPDPPDWRQVIRPEDRARLSRLWPAWTKSRSDAALLGKTAEWAALVPLSTPTAGFTGPPGPGAYRCTVVRLGATTAGLPPISVGRPFACRIAVDGDRLGFTAPDAVQRSSGRLYPDGDRLVFLGALSLRGEISPFAYGMDPDRNQVGVLERIATARWRLVLPWSHWQSTLDVVDIVPAE